MRLSLPGAFPVASALLCAACALVSTAPARAQAPGPAAPARSVLVVTVAPELREVDAAALREAVGTELGVDVVTTEDPRARQARGWVAVAVDRVAAQLVVSYSGGAEPLVRRVPLPAAADETTRTAVVLAGNLARDEAADLAAEIRRSRPAPLAAANPPGDDDERATNERDEEILRRMLADYAARDRTVRIASSLGLVMAGAGAITLGVLGRQTAAGDVSAIVGPLGVPLVFIGLFGIPFGPWDVGLTRTSTFEGLSESDPPSAETGRPWFREKVEQRWKKAAVDAHERQVASCVWVGGAGVLEIGLGGTLLALGDWRDRVAAPIDVGGIAVGAGLITWAIVASGGETKVESRLGDYERAVGRRIELDVGPTVTPVPSGLVVGAVGHWM